MKCKKTIYKQDKITDKKTRQENTRLDSAREDKTIMYKTRLKRWFFRI